MKYVLVMAAMLLTSVGAEDYDFTRTKAVTFASPGEETLRLDYWLPERASDAPGPAVILVHGGAWIAGSRKQMSWYGEHLAEAGYFVATVEYRMLPDHGFPSCLYDVKEAVRWVRRHADEFNIDPDRIAIMGSSAGGHLAALVANTDPGDGLEGPDDSGIRTDVAAAALIYPAVDLRPYEGMAEREGFYFGKRAAKMLSEFVTREQPDVDHPYVRASPITYIDSNTPPTIIFNGTGDGLVPIEHVRAYFDALAEAGVPARLIEFEGQGHGFDHVRWGMRRDLFEDVLSFFETHLAGDAVE